MTLLKIIRNRLSRFVAAIRKSQGLQPLHRRYGPIKYRYVLPALRRLAIVAAPRHRREPDAAASYRLWSTQCEELRYDPTRARVRIERFQHRPTISIILPVFNPDPAHLQKAVDSALNQYYPNWELCICDDASTDEGIAKSLLEYAARDRRIKVTFFDSNSGIARASNAALAHATGEFIGLLDHDDELTPDALLEVVATLQEVDADMIYSDEDRLDSRGRRAEPIFKPGWSPDLLLSCMYLGHFCVYRKSILDSIGAFREGFDGSQDYDLALRFTESTHKIAHIPRILYHWRDVSDSASALPRARPAVSQAGKSALESALARRQIAGGVELENSYGSYRVRREITTPGLVSIIIPTRDGLKQLSRCIASIESKTDYLNYEILIVDNGSRNQATLDYLKRSAHRVIRVDEPFNFSHLNNRAAREAAGDYLLFLNDDTEVISREWISALLEHAERPEVGAAGAKLLYPDGRIQHGGIVLGVAGVAGHAHRWVDGFSGRGYLNHANVTRNYSAVTAACMMIRRTLFDYAGGFDEQLFPVSYNDVDLCLRLRQRDYLIVYTPYALLYHDESATRGLNRYPKEEIALRARWRGELRSDYYYNPNLTSRTEDFAADFSSPESLVCEFSHDSTDEIISRLNSATQPGQEFFVEHDDFCAIAVMLQSESRDRDGIIRLRLRESVSSDQDLRVADVNRSHLRHNEWSVFYFEPIHNSGGRRYYFSLEIISNSTDDSLGIPGSAVTDEAAGSHFRNGVRVPGTPAFRVYSIEQFRYAASFAKPEAANSL